MNRPIFGSRRVLRSVALASIVVLAGNACGASASVKPNAVTLPGAAGCTVFPATNVWNKDISTLPVARNSSAMINAIGLTRGLHPDFGSNLDYGIPYGVVDASVPKVNVSFDYADESNPGPYPIPANPPMEAGGDHHVLLVNKSTCTLYEMWDARQNTDGSWAAGSGAIWNLKSNALRPDGWTSADAAGLPILPGLVRYDEVTAGLIAHALRFTAPRTRNTHIYPARHDAGHNDSTLPPMGLRVRLKASVNISKFSPRVQVILIALKHYGMLLADNGSPWYIQGVSDARWNDDDLHKLGQITGKDLEVVDTSTLRNG